jgi:chromosome segregation ATPase
MDLLSGKPKGLPEARKNTVSMKETKLEQEVQQLRFQVSELEEKNSKGDA